MSQPHTEFTRVNDFVISRCRKEIDCWPKRGIRKIIVPILKMFYNLDALGEGFQWGFPLKFGPASSIGRYVYIGSGFEVMGAVIIGDLVLISTECKIIGDDHIFNKIGSPTRLEFSRERIPTVIEADVWIGKRVLIKEGVKIGTGSVIGAGSLVVKDVEPYSIVAGVPAKKIRSRFNLNEIEVHKASVFENGNKY